MQVYLFIYVNYQHICNIYLQQFPMTKVYYFVILLLNLFVATTSILYETPNDWTESQFTTACKNMSMDGSSNIVQYQNNVVPLSNEYIYLKTSYVFKRTSNQKPSTLKYFVNIFKYSVQIEITNETKTNLQISFISGVDGSKTSQSFLIQNTYEFIDADGPFCLLKQTNSDEEVLLTLYSFDQTQGAATLIQLNSVGLDTYPNEIFKSVSFIKGSQLTDTHYSNIIGTIRSIDIETTETLVRRIVSGDGIDTIFERFTMDDVSSEVYTNLLLGLQINGNNFFTYVCSPRSPGDIQTVYANDQAALQTTSGLYSNHIVLQFQTLMMVATYDDDGQNGNIFYLTSDPNNYQLALTNMRSILEQPKESLHYLTDYYTYIIELNLNPAVNTFYVVWQDDQFTHYFSFLNSLKDNRHAQIIEDFSSQTKIASNIYGQEFYGVPPTYSSKLYLWLYSTTSIIKYAVEVRGDNKLSLKSSTINKEFAMQLTESFMSQKRPNFEVTVSLKCICLIRQITDMICFTNDDTCVFTVQNLRYSCNPIPDKTTIEIPVMPQY